MTEVLNEIRINSDYTQFVTSEYEKTLKDDSTPKIRHHVTRTPDYLNKISSSFLQNGILPPNCRYLEKLNNGHLVVIEEPPAYRTIKVNYNMNGEIKTLEAEGKLKDYGIDVNIYNQDKNNRPYSFTLAFPYTIFILMIDRYSSLMMGHVYLRNARLAGYGDYLLKIPMMNISSEQSICFGDKGHINNQSLNAAIENAIMVFWSAEFNGDYTYNYTAYKDVAGVNTYIGWEALTKIDPMFIYNVDWLKIPKSLHETIEIIKSQYNNQARKNIQYRELSRLFTQPVDSGKKEKPIKRSRKMLSLYYDIAQGIYLSDRLYVHVGDPVVWGKKIAHINSFIGFYDTDKIRYVQFELENKKLINVKLTPKVKEFIIESVKKLRFEEQGTMKNGTVIKEDDIIIIKDHRGNDIYKKTQFIRKTRDGLTEARLGNSFYILENIEGKILNLEKPQYYGIDLNKKDEYILFNNSGEGFMNPGHSVKFNGLNVKDSSSTLILEFKTTSKGKLINIQPQSTSNIRPLYKKDELKELPPIFRVGRRLMCYRFDNVCKNGYAWGTPEGISYDNSYTTTSPNILDIEKHLLSNEGTTFHVESFDLDLTFNVGDKVVYTDWENPINMLIPRTIEAFKVEKDTGSLYFVLSDKEGNLVQIKYIGGTPDGSPYIYIGKIRKIVNKFGRVIAGTKIMAEKGRIPHFPKKDVNIIIGFITDTGGEEPLVLCSNCCTLWYSDMMENFKRVTMKSKQWDKLPHSQIDITKIKTQDGDILDGSVDFSSHTGWLTCKLSNYKTTRIVMLGNLSSYSTDYKLDNYVRNNTKFDCVPNPRISPTEQAKMESVNAFPNFHGLFVESRLSPFKFLNDERSVLHVQSSRK